MRKFKLLLVVMASIIIMPTQLFAQSSDFEKLQSMKAKYNSMEPSYNKGKLKQPQLAEFEQLKQDIATLEQKLNGNQSSELDDLHDMQKQYRNMKQALDNEKNNLPTNIVQRRQSQLDELEQKIKALEQKLNVKDVKISPAELGKQILETIENRNATFSEEENLTNTLLSLEKSDERLEALSKVYEQLDLIGNRYGDDLIQFAGHKGTERGQKESVLAERIKKQMNEEGYKTFGFLPGQREDDIIVRVGGAPGIGSKIRRKNGVLVFDKDGRTFTMNDGTVFRGLFKEELTLYGTSGETYEVVANDQKLLLADELTPYHGAITYADGTTDGIKAGKSVNAHNKAVKAAIDAELKAAKSEYTKLCQKYGAATINSLKTTGSLKVGYSVTMLNDYIAVYNKYMTARVKAENGRHDPLGLRYYEPTVNEVLKYGKTAKRVKLGGTMFANELVLANCMVANGKIAAIYQNTTILAMKDL